MSLPHGRLCGLVVVLAVLAAVLRIVLRMILRTVFSTVLAVILAVLGVFLVHFISPRFCVAALLCAVFAGFIPVFLE